MYKLLIAGAIGLSLLPVWKDTREEGGINFWKYLGCWLSGPREHIPVDEAIANYREYRELFEYDKI